MRIERILNPPRVEQLIERFSLRTRPFILDSAQSNDGLGRWSFFGADPFLIIEGKDGTYRSRCEIGGHAAWSEPIQHENGLRFLRSHLAPYLKRKTKDSEIPFIGGAVGFLAYDYGRQIEVIPNKAADDRQIQDLYFAVYDGILALNHQTEELFCIALGIRDSVEAVCSELRSIIGGTPEQALVYDPPKLQSEWTWNVSADAFKQAVEDVRNFIAAGDVYQVNLSRRAQAEYSGRAVDFFQALRKGNPAPYAAFVDTGELQLISTSPEQFLRKVDRRLETRPIKGTRPRSADAAENARNVSELAASEKDRAELLMIVDLERNDFGRIAEFGSVAVRELYQIEHYERVIHQTAQVSAVLRKDQDVFDALKAVFPGGSITGAPKIRAMELIEALEPTRRGVYCGAIGYIGFDEDAEFNIAIRTLHLKDGRIDYQVGGGIVWDSSPEAEYQETLDKGRAIVETLNRL